MQQQYFSPTAGQFIAIDTNVSSNDSLINLKHDSTTTVAQIKQPQNINAILFIYKTTRNKPTAKNN